MALIKIPKEMGSTPGIVDNSNATAITIGSDESVTFSGGVDVTGTATMDGLTVDGTATVVGTTTSGILLKSASGASSGFKLYNDSGTDTAHLNNHFSGSMVFSTNNTERMRIDASGNVGIGQSNPTSPNDATDFIHIGSASNQDTSIVLQDAVETWEIYQNDDLSFLFDTTNVMTLQRLTGNVGIGVVPAAAYKMQVNVATNTVTTGSPASSSLVSISGGTTTVGDGVSLQLTNTSGAKETAWRISAVTASGNNGDLVFNGYAGGADYPERMRIDSSGRLFVSGSSISDTNTWSVSNGSQYIRKSGTGVVDVLQFYNDNGLAGQIYINGSSVVYATSSDYRLKENVVGITGATQRLLQLKPSRFNFIADANITVDGFLAHEVADVVPEAIVGTKDAVDADGNPDYQGIDQSKLVPLLVATIQELEARLTALENN